MKNKALYLLVIILVSLALVMTGCEESFSQSVGGGDKTGSLWVKITDAPDPNIEKVEVTFTGVKVHRSGILEQDEEELEEGFAEGAQSANQTTESAKNRGQEKKLEKSQNQAAAQKQVPSQAGKNGTLAGKSENDTGKNDSWINLGLDTGAEETTFNLLDYRDGLEKLVAIGEKLAPGQYNQIRLDVSKVLVTFQSETGMETREAKLPSNTLKFVHPFEIVEGKITVLVFDWDAEKSLNFTGNGQIICKPVIKLISVDTGDQASVTIVDDEDEDFIRITSDLPDGTVGENYHAELGAIGGNGDYMWSLFESYLPGGLSLADGIISGIPEEEGEFSFTIKVADTSENLLSATRSFTIQIVPGVQQEADEEIEQDEGEMSD